MSRYDKELEDSIQYVSNLMILLLNNEIEQNNIFNLINSKKIKSTNQLHSLIWNYILNYFNAASVREIHIVVTLRGFNPFSNEEEEDTKIFGGIITYMLFYLQLLLISKGLEKHHNIRLKKELFRILPRSSSNNIEYNEYIIGWNQGLRVPLLEGEFFRLGEGLCPAIKGKNGKGINEDLIGLLDTFFQNLYTNCLEPRVEKSNGIFSHYRIKFFRKPDFINLLEGSFEKIDRDALLKQSTYFEEIKG